MFSSARRPRQSASGHQRLGEQRQPELWATAARRREQITGGAAHLMHHQRRFRRVIDATADAEVLGSTRRWR